MEKNYILATNCGQGFYVNGESGEDERQWWCIQQKKSRTFLVNSLSLLLKFMRTFVNNHVNWYYYYYHLVMILMRKREGDGEPLMHSLNIVWICLGIFQCGLKQNFNIKESPCVLGHTTITDCHRTSHYYQLMAGRAGVRWPSQCNIIKTRSTVTYETEMLMKKSIR